MLSSFEDHPPELDPGEEIVDRWTFGPPASWIVAGMTAAVAGFAALDAAGIGRNFDLGRPWNIAVVTVTVTAPVAAFLYFAHTRSRELVLTPRRLILRVNPRSTSVRRELPLSRIEAVEVIARRYGRRVDIYHEDGDALSIPPAYGVDALQLAARVAREAGVPRARESDGPGLGRWLLKISDFSGSPPPLSAGEELVAARPVPGGRTVDKITHFLLVLTGFGAFFVAIEPVTSLTLGGWTIVFAACAAGAAVGVGWLLTRVGELALTSRRLVLRRNPLRPSVGLEAPLSRVRRIELVKSARSVRLDLDDGSTHSVPFLDLADAAAMAGAIHERSEAPLEERL